jgi:DNA-binding response OmpR family regulator
MPRDLSFTNLEPRYGKSCSFPWDVEIPERDADQVAIRPPTSFRQALDDEPVRVDAVEFKIMLFLASWPYHAFTRRQIAEAVSTKDRQVSEIAVDEYIASLREQLGVFHDYVQTVPHVGYRFKA